MDKFKVTREGKFHGCLHFPMVFPWFSYGKFHRSVLKIWSFPGHPWATLISGSVQTFDPSAPLRRRFSRVSTRFSNRQFIRCLCCGGGGGCFWHKKIMGQTSLEMNMMWNDAKWCEMWNDCVKTIAEISVAVKAMANMMINWFLKWWKRCCNPSLFTPFSPDATAGYTPELWSSGVPNSGLCNFPEGSAKCCVQELPPPTVRAPGCCRCF